MESRNLKGRGCQPQERVHFAFNEHIKISHDEMMMIKEFAAMARHNNDRILVVGHTDKVGSEHYNKILSLKRARRVADILVKHGISKDRIKLIGAGEKWATHNDAASRNASLFLENEETMECFRMHHHEKHQCSNHHHNKHHDKMKVIRKDAREIKRDARQINKDANEIIKESKY
jgi:hypothetical protein